MTTKSKATKRIRRVATRGVILTTYAESLINRNSYLRVQLIIELLLRRNSDRLIRKVLNSLYPFRKDRRRKLAHTTISWTDAGPIGALWTSLDRDAQDFMKELGLK